jgi:hypothetical protein
MCLFISLTDYIKKVIQSQNSALSCENKLKIIIRNSKMDAIRILNGERKWSYSIIASRAGISKPKLKKYINGELGGVEKSQVTRKLNSLIKN